MSTSTSYCSAPSDSDEASVFSTPAAATPSAVAPTPPEAPRAAASPRRSIQVATSPTAVRRSSVMAAATPTAAVAAPDMCRRLSERESAFDVHPRHESAAPCFPSAMPAEASENGDHENNTLSGQRNVHHGHPQRLHFDVNETLVPVEVTADVGSREEASANPLRREGAGDAESPRESDKSISRGGSNSTDEETATTSRVMMKESVADDALRNSSAEALLDSSTSAVFSLASITAPKTAEEYFEQVAKLDRVRCGLGQELQGEAKDIYGPTWPFSKRMFATKVLATRKCPSPNCDHKEPLRAITGPQIYSLLFIYGVLLIYPVFTTVAYAGRDGWGGIIPLWLLSGVTLIFVTLCSFTDPGIVPRRQLKNVTDRGDILIVRVPAPSAQAVLEKLQALPDIAPAGKISNAAAAANESPAFTAEAIHQAIVDGDIPASVFNHKRTTVYSMERYFETESGRVLPYNPVLSEADLAVPTLEFPITFCRTCRIAKGPRTHHCKVCNNCVDGMDHHCRWTNCCIGRNNYPYFFATLVSLHLMVGYSLAYNFAQNIIFINKHKSWTLWQMLRYVYGMPIIVYGTFFFLGLFFFPLLLGHIYMTMMGLTTNEMLKKKWTESKYFAGVNPWSHKHWYQNVYSRLLRRWPASSDDPMRWMDSRYYYGVAVAAAVEDQKVDWLIALPPEEREKVEKRAAAERDEGAKARPAQEKEIVAKAMKVRGFRVGED